jgi:hypothetical protein
MIELARRGAALRLRELLNEVQLLVDLFPDLKDSFDPDELPVSYLMETDASRVAAGAVEGGRARVRAQRPAVRRQKKRGRADRGAGEK